MKLTKRGKRVQTVALALVIGGGVWLLIQVSTHYWWTDSGFCFGSAAKCLLP